MWHRACSDPGVSRRTLLVALAVVLVGGAILEFLGDNFADPDLWGHLRYGQMILAGGGVPRVDPFSYSAPGAPWIDHEWLAEVVLAWLYDAGGTVGLPLLKLGVGVLVVVLWLAAGWRRGAEPLTAAVVLVLALTTVQPSFSFRPQLFTNLLLALEVALLVRAERRPGTPFELLAIPPLLALWANLHGGFLVGLALLLVYGAATLGRAAGFGSAPASARRVAVVALVCLAGAVAPLATPYGVDLYRFLAGTLDLHGRITEWQPVPLVSATFLRFKVYVALTVGAALVLWRRRTAERALLDWWVPFALASALAAFRHRRHVELFAIAVTPLLLLGAEDARRMLVARWPALIPRPRVLGLGALGVLAVAAVHLGDYAHAMRRYGLTIRLDPQAFGAGPIGFLRAQDLHGNVALPFDWAQYGIWRLAPASHVFIDGRFETVYPAQVIADYFAFQDGSPGWERLLDAYPTEIVVVERARNLHQRLAARPDLTLVYADPTALVFARRTAATGAALDRIALARTAAARP